MSSEKPPVLQYATESTPSDDRPWELARTSFLVTWTVLGLSWICWLVFRHWAGIEKMSADGPGPALCFLVLAVVPHFGVFFAARHLALALARPLSLPRINASRLDKICLALSTACGLGAMAYEPYSQACLAVPPVVLGFLSRTHSRPVVD